MRTARNQFGDSVGAALEAAACEGVPPVELISYFGSYIDIVVRSTGGDKSETAQMLSALSDKYSCENKMEQLAGQPIYTPCFAANG